MPKAIPEKRMSDVIEAALKDPTADSYIAFRGTWQSKTAVGGDAKTGGPLLVSGLPVEAEAGLSVRWTLLKAGEFVVEITRKGSRSLDSAQPKELPHG